MRLVDIIDTATMLIEVPLGCFLSICGGASQSKELLRDLKKQLHPTEEEQSQEEDV